MIKKILKWFSREERMKRVACCRAHSENLRATPDKSGDWVVEKYDCLYGDWRPFKKVSNPTGSLVCALEAIQKYREQEYARHLRNLKNDYEREKRGKRSVYPKFRGCK